MKRKIAAIFAADIAGYTRLVAEDEEETLRRLASYRQVTDDFIAKGGGRIFNTAGDAVLAEFPSAVEAVRCAIDIQESLRTRNMAYPPSRQMAFRIGITIGDVVERDGDLLGDGVNIAARLEGLAEVGGICISRAVHEQVANKLSVQFADIGAQEVKNIPTPVHAYMVAMRREDGTYATPQVKKPRQGAAARAELDVAGRGHVVCLVAIGVGGFLYFTKLETAAIKVAACIVVEPTAACAATARRHRRPLRRSAAPTAHAPPPPPPPPPPIPSGEKFAAATVPFIGDRTRATLANEYVAGGRLQGLRAERRRHHRLRHRPAERRGREERRARAVPEARGRRAVAAEMRALCGRRHGGLSARQAADAAAALDQARSLDRAALRVRRTCRSRAIPGKTRLESVYVPGTKDQGGRARARAGRFSFLYRWDNRREVGAPGARDVRRVRRRRLHDRGGRRCLRRSGPDHDEGHRLLPGLPTIRSIASRCTRRRRAPARGSASRLECGRRRRGRPSGTGAEGGQRTDRGQRRARQIASSATAIATSSRSARSRSGRIRTWNHSSEAKFGARRIDRCSSPNIEIAAFSRRC